MSFVHLHTHTHYSLLEGLPKPKDYVKKAKALGMKAIAITDTGNLHGCHELYKYAKEEGIKPILGAEIFVQSECDEKLFHKLVLLAKHYEGYKNLISLVSDASLSHPWEIARVEFSKLALFSEGLICLSGPISGEISYYILSGKSEEDIVKRIRQYQDIFWQENYFLEILYHRDIPKQELITTRIIEIGQKYHIPLVACQNSYYIEKDDKTTQDIIMALGTGHEIENPDRKSLIAWDYSFMNEEEMQEIFGYIPEALENTQKIADMIDIHIEIWGIRIPKFELPEEMQLLFEEAQAFQKKYPGKTPKKILSSDEWYLRYLSYAGLNWRYEANISQEMLFELVQKTDMPSLQTKLTETSPEDLKKLSLTYYSQRKKEILAWLSQDLQEKIERLEYELVVVHEMGFNAYFLIVADYIGWARKNDIPVWPGRGSAAWSLMAYLTGITDIDPLLYDLLFERFLNPARISMPDIDTDFADSERDRVVEYCREKYGADHVAQICTFGTFAARAAVKDVGRVMWVSFSEMNELGKMIPEKPGTKLSWALQDSPEFKQAYDENPKYKAIIDNALKIEGNVRQLWVHACAVIIAPEPMTNFTALAHPPKDANAIVTQYSAYPLEDLGLLKMDFLWLRNLTIIKRAQKIIEYSKGISVDILKVPMDDAAVYNVFAQGDTTGVFQFESDGMRKYLKDLVPDRFEDLIAMVSLYRPGPLAYIPSYVERKHGREAVIYMLPALREKLEKKYSQEEILEEERKLNEDLWPILNVSYGIAVYQEQLMFIVQYMAGFSLGEADLLRRWVWKKKIEVIEALKKEFITKAAAYKGYKPETSQFIYEEMIQPAANYSFNKSHAACYAFISYQTAYLKAHYRAEFLTSMMTSDEENMDRIVLEVEEALAHGIEILRPDINESLKHFTYIDDTHIRFGLKAIKGLGEGPIDAILRARQEKRFENIEDFIKRAWKEVLGKKSLEALISAWAMDIFWERGMLFAHIDDIIRTAKNEEKKQNSSQIGLFDLWIGDNNGFDNGLVFRPTPPFSYEQLIYGEKEVLGYMVSGHPLDWLGPYILRRSQNTSYLKLGFEELEQKKQKNPESWQKELQRSAVKTLGVIQNMRKVLTKTGKNMVFLSCDGFDTSFEATVFDKEYAQYKDTLKIGAIIILEGTLDINFEYKRKGIRIRSLSLATLTQVRNQAQDMGLFDGKKRILLQTFSQKAEVKDRDVSFPLAFETQKEEVQSGGEEEILENSQDFEWSNFEVALEEEIEKNKLEKVEKNKQEIIEEYIVEIPQGTKIEQIHALKEFLLSQEIWNIAVYILLSDKKVDTKIKLADIEYLKKWEQEYFKKDRS